MDSDGIQKMKVASIDIGTNTILLLVARLSGGRIVPLYQSQIITRLGKGIESTGKIQEESFDKALTAIERLILEARRFDVEKIVAVGTSALREAANREEFIKFIRDRTGIDIEVLSGEEEAYATFIGVMSGLSPELSISNITVLDIGGGSTEIITGNNCKIYGMASLDIGTVRITEKFFRRLPPDEIYISKAKDLILDHFSKLDHISPRFKNSKLIGVAATVTTLAMYDLKLEKYDGEAINGHVMGIDKIEEIYDRFKGFTLEQIKSIPQIPKGRADVILAGILILFEFMKKFNFERIIISDRGVRYGVLYTQGFLKH